MKGSGRLRWFLFGLLTAFLLLTVIGIALTKVMGASRPDVPPEDAHVSCPWGSIDLDELQIDPNSELEVDIGESFLAESPEEFDPDRDGIRDYDILALSGGGSNGAFGSGLLCGWTAAGTRPKFKIVTGVSTGALQATPAFLGPKYDYILREIYTKYDTDDIYIRRPLRTIFHYDSVNDSWPLKKLIERYITDDILAAVAKKHASGYRLYMGTTNVDTREFVIWNMGRIAASSRKDSLELFRKILLASSSMPVVFPPVYFEVESDGKKYHEMHCDGGAHAQVFFRGFLFDFQDALEDAGLLSSNVDLDLYIINNGKSLMSEARQNVAPRIFSIAAVTINNLFKITMTSSLYRIYVLTGRYGIDFNLAAIPEDSDLVMSPLEFEPEAMKQLFDLGYELAEQGYDWITVPPAIDDDEIFLD